MNTTTKPHYASVYDIQERPRTTVSKVPLLRYEECPTTNCSEAEDEYCLTGYGESTVSDHHDVVDTGENEQKRRVPRLRHTRPRSKHQVEATRTDQDPLEPEYFRHIIKRTSAERPATPPDTDFHAFFENLRNNSQTRRQRTLKLLNSPASEAIDARPRSN